MKVYRREEKWYEKAMTAFANMMLNPVILYIFFVGCVILKDLRNLYERLYS
jgi:low affinity Fe/Cu permease|tara:strand:- start:169 stop:321 length:153 start_codon:yes stop_codon:yes gene_type:complete